MHSTAPSQSGTTPKGSSHRASLCLEAPARAPRGPSPSASVGLGGRSAQSALCHPRGLRGLEDEGFSRATQGATAASTPRGPIPTAYWAEGGLT